MHFRALGGRAVSVIPTSPEFCLAVTTILTPVVVSSASPQEELDVFRGKSCAVPARAGLPGR